MKGQRILRALLVPASICFLCISGGQSETDNPATTQETKWTVEDMIAPEYADQFRISPDSQWVVWVKHVPDADKDEMVSNLYLSSLREKKEVQLTRGPNDDSSPR